MEVAVESWANAMLTGSKHPFGIYHWLIPTCSNAKAVKRAFVLRTSRMSFNTHLHGQAHIDRLERDIPQRHKTHAQ